MIEDLNWFDIQPPPRFVGVDCSNDVKVFDFDNWNVSPVNIQTYVGVLHIKRDVPAVLFLF